MKNLSDTTDNELIELIKKRINTDKNLLILIGRHEKLFYKVINKYTYFRNLECKNDFIRDKNLLIYNIILDYKENKNSKFSTFLFNKLKWILIKDYQNYKKKFKNEISIDEEYEKKYNNFVFNDLTPPIDLNINQAIEIIKKEKEKRILKIFNLRYLEGKGNKLMPWHQVCKKVDLSIQGCIDVHNKYLEKINKIRKD